MSKLAIITINKAGLNLAKRLKASFKEARVFYCKMDRNGSLKSAVKNIFYEYGALIFIAALGVTVRLIGPLARNKLKDPAVVSVDSAGRFALSVLCGHEGGANDLAFRVAACLDALPVITTGLETNKKFVLGIGTRKGIDPSRVKEAIKHALSRYRIGLDKVRLAATIDIKKNEKGLLEACRDLKLPLVFITKERIEHFKTGTPASGVVKRHIGVDGVCEQSALLAGRRAKLIAKKEILGGVTIAIARES